MADYLAIDWEKRQLCGVEGDVSKARLRIKRCFRLVWPEDLDPAKEPQRAGEWLKRELQELGVSSRQCLVTLPREDVVVRHLELPNVPDAELPDLVRFQAATRSALPLDQLQLDYLPLPARENSIGRDVLMTTVSKQAIATIQETLQVAGLEFEALGVSPIAASEVLVHLEHHEAQDPQQADLVIARHGKRVEISVLRSGQLIFTHSSRLAVDGEQQQIQSILTELSRAQVALQKQAPDVTIGRLWVLGAETEHQTLCAALQQKLGFAARLLDPLTVVEMHAKSAEAPGNHALYAGPIGLLLAREDARAVGVDFLHPRRPPVQQDRRKLRIAIAAAGIVVLLGLGLFQRHQTISTLDEDLANLQDEASHQTELVKRGESQLKVAEALLEWQTDTVNWLSPMREVVAAMPGTDRAYLIDWHFTITPGRTAATIRGEGQARTRSDVDEFNDRLSLDKSYAVRPHAILRGERDPEYPYRFELDVDRKLIRAEDPKKTPQNDQRVAATGDASPGTGPVPGGPRETK